MPAPDALPLGNAAIAARLDEAAALLDDRQDNPYRARAYRNAAATVRGLGTPVDELLRTEGPPALLRLPGVGPRLARAIETLALTGHLPLLDRLGADGPEDLLASVTGVGPGLAHRIHEALHVETLEDLEVAAHDGRLAQVPGLGPKRLRGIREALAGRFRRPAAERPRAEPPPVAELLEVDRLYRERADAGLLKRLAPRRFNPSGEAWLPVLRLRRHGRRYRALFSNTELAHRLGRNRDWVVIYFDEGVATGQCTVVTAQAGRLKGRRVVRGREGECRGYYRNAEPPVAG